MHYLFVGRRVIKRAPSAVAEVSDTEINTTLQTVRVSVPATGLELRPIDVDLVQHKPLMAFM
jgi:hypothetical protein